MGTTLLAIKIGSSTTTIYKQGDGFLLSEPTLVAYRTTGKGRETVAVGFEAKKYQKTLDATRATLSSPVSEGVIVDSELCADMLRAFLDKIFPRRLIKPSVRALICVPLGISVAERLTFEKVCYNAGIGDVILIPSCVCSAVGSGVDIASDSSRLVIGLGGGCTDIAVLGQNMLISGLNIGMGGISIDKAIISQILTSYNLVISDIMAEKIKKEIGSIYLNDLNSMMIVGKDAETKETKQITITAMDIYAPIEHYYHKIAESIASLLTTLSPEISTDVIKNETLIVGGDSKIAGIEKYFKNKVNINVKTVNQADDLDLVGASKLLSNPDMLKRLLINI